MMFILYMWFKRILLCDSVYSKIRGDQKSDLKIIKKYI